MNFSNCIFLSLLRRFIEGKKIGKKKCINCGKYIYIQGDKLIIEDKENKL